MASITKLSEPEIADNHRDSWVALLAAADAYCQKSGSELAILTACKKFRSSAPETDATKKKMWEGSGGGFPRECEFSYSIWGQGFLAESVRRYVDDIGVLHSTTLLTAQRHTRHAAAEITSDAGRSVVSQPHACSTRVNHHAPARRIIDFIDYIVYQYNQLFSPKCIIWVLSYFRLIFIFEMHFVMFSKCILFVTFIYSIVTWLL